MGRYRQLGKLYILPYQYFLAGYTLWVYNMQLFLMIFMRFNLQNLNFGKLILMKIIEIAVTKWHILKLKVDKFDFGRSSALTALPRIL